MERSITVTNLRNKGGEIFGPDVYLKPFSQALESFVVYELGYGGNVTEVSDGEVVVQTRIMGCVDTTKFAGNYNDVDVFRKIGYIHALIKAQHGDDILSMVFDHYFKGKPEGIVPSKLVLANLGPILAGETNTELALLTYLEIIDEATLSTFNGKLPTVKDLCSAVALQVEGATKEEIIELLH